MTDVTERTAITCVLIKSLLFCSGKRRMNMKNKGIMQNPEGKPNEPQHVSVAGRVMKRPRKTVKL